MGEPIGAWQAAHARWRAVVQACGRWAPDHPDARAAAAEARAALAAVRADEAARSRLRGLIGVELEALDACYADYMGRGSRPDRVGRRRDGGRRVDGAAGAADH